MSEFRHGPIAAEACIFDFDGVILDTERYHHASWVEACAPLGLTLSEEEYLPLRSTGRPFIAAFLEKKAGRPFSEEEREALFSRKQAAYSRMTAALSEADLLGGVLPFLEKLKANGIPAAVATSSAQARTLAERFGILPLLSAFLGADLPLPKKPAPDLFLAAAKALGVPPRRCAVFEDSEAGIRAGLAAGMQTVAVGAVRLPGILLAIEDFTCFLA